MSKDDENEKRDGSIEGGGKRRALQQHLLYNAGEENLQWPGYPTHNQLRAGLSGRAKLQKHRPMNIKEGANQRGVRGIKGISRPQAQQKDTPHHALAMESRDFSRLPVKGGSR